MINFKKILDEMSLGLDALPKIQSEIDKAIGMMSDAIDNGNKILICGNGGSAADSQHIAAELVGRFEKERRAIPAIALSTDTSILTAIANDYQYQNIFSRQIEALGKKGDILLAISTSGNSPNILMAIETANENGLICIALTNENGGAVKSKCDVLIAVPSKRTFIVQQLHQIVYHYICSELESKITN